MTYPLNWPKCACGAPVMDSHLTCGRATCAESKARDRARRECTRLQIADQEGGTPVSILMLTWLSTVGRKIRRC
jgi:hypothetical protein